MARIKCRYTQITDFGDRTVAHEDKVGGAAFLMSRGTIVKLSYQLC